MTGMRGLPLLSGLDSGGRSSLCGEMMGASARCRGVASPTILNSSHPGKNRA
jgi:hypothetical protein